MQKYTRLNVQVLTYQDQLCWIMHFPRCDQWSLLPLSLKAPPKGLPGSKYVPLGCKREAYHSPKAEAILSSCPTGLSWRAYCGGLLLVPQVAHRCSPLFPWASEPPSGLNCCCWDTVFHKTHSAPMLADWLARLVPQTWGRWCLLGVHFV